MLRQKWLKAVLFIFLILNIAGAAAPKYVSTFQSIGLYWTPDGGADSLDVLVNYREKGTEEWKEGLPMKYRSVGGTTNELTTYRGSLVNLTPNTVYEVKLSLENTEECDTLEAKTWTEDFPIAKTYNIGDSSKTIYANESGTSDGYILYDGNGATIDVNDKSNYCFYVSASYIIIRNFKLTGAHSNAIILKDVHDVIIENCDISVWGEEEEDERGFGKDYQGAIYSTSSTLKRVVVQRCLIHHPRWDASNWSEYREVGTPSYHPRGPQAIAFYNSSGNHVFRYNEIWSDYDHMFNDIIGYGSNGSYEGSPNCDTDIYGNYISNCWDDGIEAEGADRNVRIWGNYIENVLIPIANAPVTIGPLYIWKNTTGRSYTPKGSQVTGTYGAFIKMGSTKSSKDMMDGTTYLFNNTLTQPNGEGVGGIGSHYGSERQIKHCMTRNNLLHVRKRYDHYMSVDDDCIDTDYDYDMGWGGKGFPEGSEEHGFVKEPVYIDGAKFDFKTMTANFFLVEGNPGVDAGEIIPNFSDGYQGSAPDMGAFESGTNPLEYGINAYLDGSPTRYVLRVSCENGTTSPISGAFAVNEKVQITAIPDSGYQFDHWEGDLTSKNNPEEIVMSENMIVTPVFTEVTAIDESGSASPNSFFLDQNYPNPFNPATVIRYGIEKNSYVSIEIYNTLGQKIATLLNEYKNAGQYEIEFSGANLSSGVYIYLIKAGNYSARKKMLLIK